MQHCTPIDPQTFAPLCGVDDVRLGHTARRLDDATQLTTGDIVLLGVPDERGTLSRKAYAGAVAGPAAFRAQFYQLTGAWRVWDAGDVPCGINTVATQQRVAEVVRHIVAAGALPILIGGSSDQTIGGIAGVTQAGALPGLLQCSAQLPVRQVRADAYGNIHADGTLRRVLDERLIAPDDCWAFGAQPQLIDAAQTAWARQHGVQVWDWNAVQSDPLLRAAQICAAAATDDGLAVAFALDLIEAAAVPGVHAPQPLGLRAAEAVALFRLFAQQRLRYLDVTGLTPAHDVGTQTAALAALLVWTVCHERMERT